MPGLIFLAANTSIDFKKIWNDIVTYFKSNYWNIILFFAVLIVGFALIKIVIAIVRKGLARSKMEQIAQSLLMHVLKYALYLVFVLILLAIVGVQITGIITALSAVLLAVGMALKDNIANFANGIIIVSSHMFNKGDFIEVNGTQGTVQDINLLFTTLSTVDNRKVILPNSAIVTNTLINFGANGTRRVDFTFSVAYETDVDMVKKTVLAVMHSYNKIKLDPAPFCRLKVLNSSSIDFFANCWCDSADYWDVYYYVTENVFNELKRNGVSIPFTQTEVRVRTDIPTMPVSGEGLPERAADPTEEKKKKDEDAFPFSLPNMSEWHEKHSKKENKKNKKKQEEKADEQKNS